MGILRQLPQALRRVFTARADPERPPSESYVAEISRSNPSCFLFLIDQSASMLKPFGGAGAKIKAEGVADTINRLLQNLCLKCTKSDGVRDYFHIGVIGYGGTAKSAFSGALDGRLLVPVSELADNPLRLEERPSKADDQASQSDAQRMVKFPVWFEPRGEGKTPMCQALNLGRKMVADFLAQYPSCYPPVVVNITDGMATDDNPQPVAKTLCELAGTDGNVLLFNAHLSSLPNQPIEFPDSEGRLPDDFAKLLFRMSSQLPLKIQAAASDEGYRVSSATRGFVFNADLDCIIRFVDIGTKVAQGVR